MEKMGLGSPHEPLKELRVGVHGRWCRYPCLLFSFSCYLREHTVPGLSCAHYSFAVLRCPDDLFFSPTGSCFTGERICAMGIGKGYPCANTSEEAICPIYHSQSAYLDVDGEKTYV